MKGVAAVALALALAAPGVEHEAAHAPFPTPPRALTLAWEGDGPTVDALLEAYADATGRLVLMSSSTRKAIRGRVAAIESDTRRIDVAPGELHAVLEELLLANQLVLSEAFTGRSRSAVHVVSLRSGEIRAFLDRLPLVPVASIDGYRGHPAVLVETWVPVGPAVDAHALAVALHGAMADVPDVQRFAAVGHGVLLRGFGPDVCALVEFVREVDALCRAGEELDGKALNALADRRFQQPAEEPK